jgi:hypothetical protein
MLWRALVLGCVSLSLCIAPQALAVGAECVDGPDTRVTNDIALSVQSSLVWNGVGFALALMDSRDGNFNVYFARLDATGTKIPPDVRVTNAPSNSQLPTLVWTGSDYGVAWAEQGQDQQIYFARLGPSGEKIGGEVRITNNFSGKTNPTLVWTGSEFGISWTDDRSGQSEIYFARLDASGAKIGSDRRVSDTPPGSNSDVANLVWTGSEFGIAWRDFRHGAPEIYFARLDASGANVGSNTRITNSAVFASHPDLAWTGTEYGVSWFDERDGDREIYFARLDSTGTKIGTDVRITQAVGDSRLPSLVWTGKEFGIAWYEATLGSIHLTRVDSSGTKVGTDLRITDPGSAALPSSALSLAWTGGFFGISWQDERDGNQEIYFSRVVCPLQVVIDIKPGSDTNSINPRSNGRIPVAILTTGTFDATTVNPTKALFGRTGTEAAPVHAALEDVNGDGKLDLVLHFNTQATGIPCGNTSAFLTGDTRGGQAIEGSDSIQTVGCK